MKKEKVDRAHVMFRALGLFLTEVNAGIVVKTYQGRFIVYRMDDDFMQVIPCPKEIEEGARIKLCYSSDEANELLLNNPDAIIIQDDAIKNKYDNPEEKFDEN
jgi:hypothetical protein